MVKCLTCGHEALCMIQWKNGEPPCEGFYHQGPFEEYKEDSPFRHAVDGMMAFLKQLTKFQQKIKGE